MANDLFIPIASEDPRLKRRINHDSRSALYKLPTDNLELKDVEWICHLLFPLDQEDVGACTAETVNELLASNPFFETLPQPLQADLLRGDQEFSLNFYAEETASDNYPGIFTYPPKGGEDTGSDGLTMGRVALKRGYISGFQHTFSTEDALKGIQLRPGGWGTIWKEGMDNVNEDTGEVRYTGRVRGGHEIEAYKVDVARQRLWFRNHWNRWGYQRRGVAWISWDDFDLSLQDQGDMIFFTPLSKPAPLPQPTPSKVDTLFRETEKFRNGRFPCTGAGEGRRALKKFFA